MRSHFYVQWAAEFNSPPEPTALSEDFTGLRHHRISKVSTEISCHGVIKALADLIVGRPLPPMKACDSPLPLGALARLADPPSESNPLEPALV